MILYKSGNSGIVLGGPDILPDSDTLNLRVYPRYHTYHGQIPMFCSMQNDSFAHTHTTTTPDPRMPNDSWDEGDPWLMDEMFRWSRDDLLLNYVIWNRNVGTPRNWEPDGRLVVAAYPTFNV
jgi:hypothetical protein